MRRREFITLLGGATAAWPLATHAQQTGRSYRIGYLAASVRTASHNVAFFDELRASGLIEGQNLTVLSGSYGVRNELLAETAALFVNALVDAIVAPANLPALTARNATRTIPIVAMSTDM